MDRDRGIWIAAVQMPAHVLLGGEWGVHGDYVNDSII